MSAGSQRSRIEKLEAKQQNRNQNDRFVVILPCKEDSDYPLGSCEIINSVHSRVIEPLDGDPLWVSIEAGLVKDRRGMREVIMREIDDEDVVDKYISYWGTVHNDECHKIIHRYLSKSDTQKTNGKPASVKLKVDVEFELEQLMRDDITDDRLWY